MQGTGTTMRVNVGRVDAWVRGTLAAILLVVAALLSGQLILSLGAAIVALLLGGTALTHNCPVYTLFGIDTKTHHPRAQS